MSRITSFRSPRQGTMTFPRLGAIFDRAVHLLVRNAVPFAVCMSPAIVLSILASAADPGSLSAEEVIGANGDVSSYERAYWLFSGALIVATFAQWVCAAAVMIGVRWLLRGYPPSPLTWMLVGIARTPALLLTFLLPTLPMVVPLILIGTTAYRLSQAIANDPDSLDFQIGLLRYESLGVVVLGVIAVPLAGVASAVVVLDGLRPVRAVVVAMRTCFSRTQFKRFLALSADRKSV